MRFIAALIVFMLSSPQAEAALKVCNRTAHAARVAVGRFDGRHWLSEGWWSVAPKACGVLVPGTLKARYYYLYAADNGSGSWSGASRFCVGTGEKFHALRGHCAAQGMDSKGFFVIDTGNASDFTQSLSD